MSDVKKVVTATQVDSVATTEAKPSRRKFPMISVAQTPITMRWQSTWPAKDIFHEYALDFAKKVNDMSGGRLKIEVLPAGAVVKAFELLDAVSKGTLDGGHGVVAYWYGAIWLVQEAGDQSRRHEGRQVPYRRIGGRHVQGAGRGRESATWSGNRSGDGSWSA